MAHDNAPQARRIGIVGGGPGGLTLARLLVAQGLAPIVLELDAGPEARPQGGSLDLHPESGLLALDRAGLRAGFEAIARHEDQEVRIYARTGELLFEDADAAAGDRPEVDRGELRGLLLASLPAGTVAWGQKVTRIEPLADCTMRVHVAAAAPRTFDVVVGADGTWSRVRPRLTTARPAYSGVTFVELEVADIDAAHPTLARLVGRGKLFAPGDRKAIIAQRNGHGTVRVYVAQHAPERWARELAGVPAANVKAQLLAALAGWAPALRGFIEHSGDHVRAQPLYALPVGLRWPHRRGITLLGDAAHAMSPFAGEGVNNAMADALALAAALAEPAWDAAVARYEAAMAVRIAPSAVASADGLAQAMSVDGAARMVELMRSHSPPHRELTSAR